MYAIDWATRKELRVYNMRTRKLTKVASDTDGIIKFVGKLKPGSSLFMEEGGGDSLKLLAFKKGHKVFTIPGIQVKKHREELGMEKSDEADAVIIGNLATTKPDGFYHFQKLDSTTAEISVLVKERTETKKAMVRSKNQLFALERRLEFMDIDKKVIERKKEVIQSHERLFNAQERIIGKRIKNHPLTPELQNIRGVGSIVISGLIAGIKRIERFGDKGSLRHYGGIIPKDNGYAFNHGLKETLYFFVEGAIKLRTPKWRDLYDNMKLYYADRHEDWRKGKVDAFAKKFVAREFLDYVYDTWMALGNGDARCMQ